MRCSNRVPSQLPEVLQKPAGPPGGEARLGSPSDPGQASLHLLLTMLSPDFTFKQLSEYYLSPTFRTSNLISCRNKTTNIFLNTVGPRMYILPEISQVAQH